MKSLGNHTQLLGIDLKWIGFKTIGFLLTKLMNERFKTSPMDDCKPIGSLLDPDVEDK